MDVPTDGWTFPPLMLLGQLGEVDLNIGANSIGAMGTFAHVLLKVLG